MKEITIHYKDSKVLALLKNLAGYLDFTIEPAQKNTSSHQEYDYINEVPVVRGNSSVDIEKLKVIFTGKNLDSQKLRMKVWQRQK